MCKKWAYYVRFACVLFCISCTLFLNTLHVDAANDTSRTANYRFIFTPSISPVTSGSYTGGNSSSGSITVTNTQYVGYNQDISIPFTLLVENRLTSFNTQAVKINLTDLRFSFSSTYGSYNNAYITTSDGFYLGNISTTASSLTIPYELAERYKSIFIPPTAGSYYYNKYDIPLVLHLTCFGNRVVTTTSGGSLANQVYDDVSVTVYYGYSLSYYSYSISSTLVTDTNSNAIKDAVEGTQEATEEVAETTGSIFSSITDFFGSFFENLIGIFVPEDDFFTDWFNSLNTLLTDKLGILYYPFSVIISFLNRCTTAFANQGTGTDIVFPAIEFTNVATNETYTFLSAQHINLADFNITTSSSPNSSLVGSSGFGSLVDIIRTFNAFVILFCLLSLLRTKLNLILREDNNDN